MKTVFKILPSIDENESQHLLAEVGSDGISFLFYSTDPLKVNGLLGYQFDPHLSATQIAAEITSIVENEPALKQGFSAVNICYNFKESMLVPKSLHHPSNKDEMLSLAFGSNNMASSMEENIRGKEIVHIYSVNKKIAETLRECFPFTTFYHTNTLLLALPDAGIEKLQATIYHNSIKVVLHSASQLLLTQQFDYQTATDVAYHLLNVCEQHHIDPATVELQLNGMIEERSNLYEELYKYFLNISFSLPAGNIEFAPSFNEYPAHFFSHLTLLASCV